jgi:hypothetical protein
VIVLGMGFIARALWRRVIRKRQDRIAAHNVEAGVYASLAIFGDASDGRQPKGLRLAEMLGNGPLVWNAQRETWGFSD